LAIFRIVWEIVSDLTVFFLTAEIFNKLAQPGALACLVLENLEFLGPLK